MCGIYGIMDLNAKIEREELRKMESVLYHRGPDSRGSFETGNLGLGLRRLSIIDLKSGDQPIYNEDKTVVVVLNGEIYNFIELRNELEKKGHKFYTRSDVEVIVHLYEEMGERCLDEVNGMYAFALWDMKKEILWLARDRIGIKQLYYYNKNGRFAFASEIKALLQVSWISHDLNLDAISDYFSFLYIPSPITVFKEINALQQGTILKVVKGNICIKKYWDITRVNAKNMDINDDDARDYLDFLLHDSIKLQLRSDVPVGTFLSGGLDSSTVTAYVSGISNHQVNTFSVGFDCPKTDELREARAVADLYQTNHREITVTYIDAIHELPAILWFLDQPIADSATIPTYMISKLARQHVKVVLNGTGGDELLGGYLRYRLPNFTKKMIVKLPRFISNNFLPSLISFYNPNLAGKIREHASTKNVFLTESTVFSQDLIRLLAPTLPKRSQHHDISWKSLMLDTIEQEYINQLAIIDILQYLPDDLLFLLDRMTMAASIEGRVPVLDHRIVEFLSTISANHKIRGNTRKYLLRKVVNNHLPSVIFQKEKKGFNSPLQTWTQKGLLSLCKRIILSKKSMERGFWNTVFLNKLFTSKPTWFSGQLIWTILIFELWMRVYIDTSPSSKPDWTLLDV